MKKRTFCQYVGMIGVLSGALSISDAAAQWISSGDGRYVVPIDPVQAYDWEAAALNGPTLVVSLPDGRMVMTVGSLDGGKYHLGYMDAAGAVFTPVLTWTNTVDEEEGTSTCEIPDSVALSAIVPDNGDAFALFHYRPATCDGVADATRSDLLIAPVAADGASRARVVSLDYDAHVVPQFAFTASGREIGPQTVETNEPALYDGPSVTARLEQGFMSGFDAAHRDRLQALYAGDHGGDGDWDIVVLRQRMVSVKGGDIVWPGPDDYDDGAYWTMTSAWEVVAYNSATDRFEAPQAIGSTSLSVAGWPRVFGGAQAVFEFVAAERIEGTRQALVEWELDAYQRFQTVKVLQDDEQVLSVSAGVSTQNWVSASLPLGTSVLYHVVAVSSNGAAITSAVMRVDIPAVILAVEALPPVEGKSAIQWTVDPVDTIINGWRVTRNGVVVSDWFDLDATNRMWMSSSADAVDTDEYVVETLLPGGITYIGVTPGSFEGEE